MRIKSKEIATALNLSEATVSLALNNRPGVKDETRIKIQNYLSELEIQKGYQEKPNIAANKGCILMVSYIKHGLIMMRSEGSESIKENHIFIHIKGDD